MHSDPVSDLRRLVPRPLWKLGGAAYRRVAGTFATPEHSRWLPLDSRFFGPPRRWSHTPDYCRKYGHEWREVVPASIAKRQPPHCVNYPAAQLLEMVATELPAAGVARLRNARVVCPHGWIVAEGDTYLPDHSWHGYAVGACPVYLCDGLESTARLSGVTLSLCTDWSPNYGHMMFDALSRVSLFERSGYSWDDVSQVLVPTLSSGGRESAAQLCGIPPEKMLTLNTFSVVECEELIAPTFPGVRCNNPTWVGEFWRSKSPPAPQQGRRLFLSRRGSKRTLLNEDALTPILEAAGFETIVPGVDAIRDLLSQAEIIIGPHGAALTDVMFCHPGSILVELTPPGHIEPYYYTAADSAGMSYFSILGTYPNGQCVDGNVDNFLIAPEVLKQTIAAADAMLQSRRDQS